MLFYHEQEGSYTRCMQDFDLVAHMYRRENSRPMFYPNHKQTGPTEYLLYKRGCGELKFGEKCFTSLPITFFRREEFKPTNVIIMGYHHHNHDMCQNIYHVFPGRYNIHVFPNSRNYPLFQLVKSTT